MEGSGRYSYEVLQEVREWFVSNRRLSINFKKSAFVPCGVYQDSLAATVGDLSIKFGNALLERQDYCKYLGVMVDCHLR